MRSPTPTEDTLILVDLEDRVIGHAGKRRCHRSEGLLHRAFSVFIFDERGRLLLQKRGARKPLWPAYWSNSCCSHPREGEPTHAAALRRLWEELGLSLDSLELVYKFHYRAKYGEIGSEHELCHVFFGKTGASPKADPAEIEALRSLSPEEVDRALQEDGARYSPWFRLEWRAIRACHAEILELYASGGLA